MKKFTATEAKNNFGQVLEAIDSDVVEVVKNGKVAAYILSPLDYSAMGASHSQFKIKQKILANDKQVIDLLRRYSKGVIDKHKAMRDLNLTSQGQLLDAMGVADLPLPRVPQDELDKMVAAAVKVIGS
ncbi:MAG: type II toxin-antitoxin system Phd/YefM family antitoxin [Burkholderiales bacterium]